MNIIVAILRQSLDRPALAIEGFSRTVYQFLWDTKKGHYFYRPKTQQEVDDLMLNQVYFHFTVIEVPPEKTPVVRDVAAIEALRTALPQLDREELDVVTVSVGLKTQTNDSNSIKIRVIDAFLTGTKYNGDLPRIAE